MKTLLRISIFLAISALSTSVYAIDCSRASARIDHLICADPKLMKADAAMSMAYTAILKSAPDPQIHAMLVSSQKRWIAARNKEFGDLTGATNGMNGETYTKAQAIRMLFRAMDERRRALATTSRTGQPELITKALQQQKLNSQFTGGIFAGFDVKCEFIPLDLRMSDLYYSCLGMSQYQNANRICHRYEEWASWHSTQWLIVADINSGKPKIIKTCKDNECSPTDASDKGEHRKSSFKIETLERLKQPKFKLDAEAYDSREDAFWKACLTQKDFSPEPYEN